MCNLGLHSNSMNRLVFNVANYELSSGKFLHFQGAGVKVLTTIISGVTVARQNQLEGRNLQIVVHW